MFFCYISIVCGKPGGGIAAEAANLARQKLPHRRLIETIR